MTSVEAFCLVAFGTLSSYVELIRPGRVVPGVAGCLCLAFGAYGFAGLGVRPGGVLAIALSGALFLLEAFWRVPLWAGAAATIILTIGFMNLVRAPGSLPAAAVIPICCALGWVTVTLCQVAKRARHSKWHE